MKLEKAQVLHRRYHRLTRLARRLHDRNGTVPMPLLTRIDTKQRQVRLLAEAHGWDVFYPDRARPTAETMDVNGNRKAWVPA